MPVCGGNLDGPNGELNIYNLTMVAPIGIHPICEWNVTVRPGRTVQVDISSISIDGKEHCTESFLMVTKLLIFLTKIN